MSNATGAQFFGNNAHVRHSARGGWEDAAKQQTPVYAARSASAGGSGGGWDVDAPPEYLAPGLEVGGVMARGNRRLLELGRNALVADVMLAEYDGADSVFVLERQGQRNPLADPWTVGTNITLLAPSGRAATGIVIRGASTGQQGPNDHYFIAAPGGPGGKGAPVILHHRAPDAPDNSTPAFDPDDQGVEGLLSDSLRIRGGLSRLVCTPKTVAPITDDGPSWVMLNATKHGGDRHSGWLATTFRDVEALQSGELDGGPLVATGPEQTLGRTNENRDMRMGGINARGLIGVHLGKHAPFNWRDDPEPPVTIGEGHRFRVDALIDYKRKHAWGPGCDGQGVRDLSVELPIGMTPKCDETRPPAAVVAGDADFPEFQLVYAHAGFLSASFVMLPTPEVI